MNVVLFSHKSDHWSTPEWLYSFFIDELGAYDPCPLMCDVDNLDKPWAELNFINPPYSDIPSWAERIKCECLLGHTCLVLVPARTDTKWFRLLYGCSSDLIFFTGRLRFGNSVNSAPFPSVLFVCQYTDYGCRTHFVKNNDVRYWDWFKRVILHK